MMKILYLTTTSVFAGAERVTLDIAEEMQKREHTVIYCGLEGEIRNFVEKRNVTFKPMKKFSLKNVRRIIKSIKPDMIHAVDYRASLYSAILNKRFVSHLHTGWPWLKKRNIKSSIAKYAFTKAKEIIIVSSSIKTDFIHGQEFAKKIICIPNTVDAKKIREKCLLPKNSPEGSYEIAYLGRLAKPKQPLEFVGICSRIMRRHPKWQAVMIGDGDMRIQVDACIAENGMQNNITLSGFVENPFPYICNSKILIMPSAWEGFGLAAVEAMVLGKPVLAAPVGGLKDIVDGSCGMLCAKIEDYVQEAEKLLTDESYYEKKSKGAKKRAEDFSDTQRYYDSIEKIYIN